MTCSDDSSFAWNEQRYTENGEAPKETIKHPPIILYRASTIEEKELKVLNKYFVSTDSRVKVHRGDLVIGRYSVLPYYKDLESDLYSLGSKLINSYAQHCYAADLQNWYFDLENLTPKTWFRLEDVPDMGGPYVLKGETNSKKDLWKTHMFAENKQEAIKVYSRLCEDSLIGSQRIYIREFVNFKTLMRNVVNDRPVTNEFRVFVYKKQILAGGFYWSDYVDDLQEKPSFSSVPKEFLQKVIAKVGDNIPFFTVDVAQLENGEYQVVEINDGQMSGLSECNPDELYKNLKDLTWNNQV